MSCYLRVNGRRFNMDAYLKKHPCEITAIHRRGELMFKHKAKGPKVKCSGFNILISNPGFKNLKQQIRDALFFLKNKENAEQISILVKYPGVEDVILDFGVSRKERDKHPVKWYYFPSEILKLAGSLNVGLEITFY